LSKWLVKEGDKVNAGDVIAEIETDKATMEIESADEGTVTKLLIKEGTESVPVNSPIAVLDGEGNENDDADNKDDFIKTDEKINNREEGNYDSEINEVIIDEEETYLNAEYVEKGIMINSDIFNGSQVINILVKSCTPILNISYSSLGL